MYVTGKILGKKDIKLKELQQAAACMWQAKS
jgi:hypothetical protein